MEGTLGKVRDMMLHATRVWLVPIGYKQSRLNEMCATISNEFVWHFCRGDDQPVMMMFEMNIIIVKLEWLHGRSVGEFIDEFLNLCIAHNPRCRIRKRLNRRLDYKINTYRIKDASRIWRSKI